MIKKVTLDSNLLIEYWKKQEKQDYIKKLIELGMSGEIDLSITSRIEQDIPNPPLSQMIKNLPMLGIQKTGSVTRFGLWKMGSDQLGSEKFGKFADKINNQPKAPNLDLRDWDHLHAHYLQKRDVFLTWDRRILSLGKELVKQLSIVVMKPEEFIDSEHTN